MIDDGFYPFYDMAHRLHVSTTVNRHRMVGHDGAVVGEKHRSSFQWQHPKPCSITMDMCGIAPHAFRISR